MCKLVWSVQNQVANRYITKIIFLVQFLMFDVQLPDIPAGTDHVLIPATHCYPSCNISVHISGASFMVLFLSGKNFSVYNNYNPGTFPYLEILPGFYGDGATCLQTVVTINLPKDDPNIVVLYNCAYDPSTCKDSLSNVFIEGSSSSRLVQSSAFVVFVILVATFI
jgi:hypothetical protein